MKKHERHFYVIGGANIDILGKSSNLLRPQDSNPGKVSISFGGVGRNIAENLARWGFKVSLLTVFGDDLLGKQCAENCQHYGIDLSSSLFVKDTSSSAYIAIANQDGEMALGIADMTVLDHLHMEHVLAFLSRVHVDDILIIDTNINESLLKVIVDHAPCAIVCDPISTAKAQKIRVHLSRLTIFKPNRIEAEIFCGFAISDDESLMKALQYYRNQGIKDVIISLGSQGGAVCSQAGIYRYRNPDYPIVSTTGAGDSFIAAYAAYYQRGSLVALQYAMAAAMLACLSEDTIAKNSTKEKLDECVQSIQWDIKEYIYEN